jgi:hypothetical protein
VLTPVVTGDETGTSHQQWGDYSVNNQDWISHSYEELGWDGMTPVDVPDRVYDIHPETGHHYYPPTDATVMPIWQRAAAPKDSNIINYNLLSNPDFAQTVDFVSSSNVAQLSKVVDVSKILGGEQWTKPESLLVQPILRSYVGTTTTSDVGQIVANIVAAFSWDNFLANLYATDHDPMITVIHPNCGTDESDIPFSYQLNGPDVIYLGQGDFHDTKFDDIVVVVDVDDAVGITLSGTTSEDGDDLMEGQCDYTISIYPTVAFEESSTSNAPVIYTTIVVLMFTILATVFMFYDIGATRRQREAQEEAARSNAIVNSLFPAEIRDRLLQEEDNQKKIAKNAKAAKESSNTAQKYRLKNYIDDENDAIAENNKGKDLESGDTIPESKPM